MMAKRIVYARHSDHSVWVCTPTEWAIGMLSSGGFWADKPRGFVSGAYFPRSTRRRARARHGVSE
jgi:hypothetical protein